MITVKKKREKERKREKKREKERREKSSTSMNGNEVTRPTIDLIYLLIVFRKENLIDDAIFLSNLFIYFFVSPIHFFSYFWGFLLQLLQLLLVSYSFISSSSSCKLLLEELKKKKMCF